MKYFSGLLSGLRRPASVLASGLVIGVALLVLAGWTWDIPALKSVLPGYVSMKVNAAVCALLLGLALLLTATGRQSLRRLSRVPVLPAVVTAGLVLAQHLTGADLGIDQLLFADRATEGHFHPGRMSLNTSICFLLAGAGAWLFTRARPPVRAAQVLFALSFLIAYAALLSYCYGVKGFTGLDNYTQMALHASLCLLVLSAGFLLLAPREGYLALLNREYEGGRTLQHLVLAALLLPLLTGSLVMGGYRQGNYSLEFGIALFAMVYSVLLLGVLFVGFGRLRAGELVRDGQEMQLKEVNQELAGSLEELRASEEELQSANEELTSINEELQATNEQLKAAKGEVERLSAEALRTSEQRYRELADSISDPVVMVNQEFQYLYVNKAAGQVSGRAPSEMLGKTPAEVFGQAAVQQAGRRKDAILRVLANGQKETLVDEVIHGPLARTFEITIYPTSAGHALIITRDITDRVEAEQRYRELAESLTLPLVVYDKDLRYRYLNRAVEEINGMPASELLGKTGREAFGEKFAPREQVCRQVMETGKPVTYLETPLVDGKKHYWEIGVYPTGRGGTLVLNHDITELVEARQHLQQQQEELEASYGALQASEGRLRKVLDSMFIFAGLFSTDGRLLYANAAPLKAVGIEPDEVLGKPFADSPWFHAEEERRKLRENLARAARGETVRYDSSTLDKDGNILYLDITLGPLCNEQGEVVQIIGSGVDVTARKEAKRKLEESNDRYQALVTNFPNGTVFLVDREMRYQVVGGAGLAEVGLSEQMMLGKTPLEIFPPEVAAPFVESFRKTLGGDSLSIDDRFAGLVHQVRTTPILDEAGQVVGAMAITQNVTREKEAEEGLKFYQFLVDHTKDPIYWISPEDNFRFSYVNQAACEHFGLPEEQLLSMSIPDWDPSFTWEKCTQFSTHIREKKQVVFETRHRHAGGEVIPVEVSATLLRYKGKEYYGGYFKDLRERKKAEAALRESEERYRHLFESNKDPLFLVDMESGQITDANPAACQIYGYTRRELLALKNTDISAEPEKTRRSMQDKEAVVPLGYHRKKGGTAFPVELVFNYLLINGRHTAIVAVRDITERVEASRKLEQEKQRLELALWGASLGMFDWCIPNGEVIFNERWPQLLGFTLEELKPHADTWEALLHPEDKPLVLQELDGYLAGKTTHYHSQHRLRGKNGEWVWTLASGKVVERDPDGKPVRMIGVQQDISGIKKSEAAIRESEQKFRSLFEANQDALFLLDVDTADILDVNPTACQVYGYSREEILSMRTVDLSAQPEETARVPKLGQAKVPNRSHRKKDGTVFPVELSLTYYNQHGRRLCFASSRDITERVEASRKLEEEKQRLELALKGADMGLWDWNVQTGAVIYSQRVAAMLGYRPEELRPHADGWTELGHAEDVPKVWEHLQSHLEGHVPLFQAEHRVRCKDGNWKWILDSGKVIERDEAGKPLRMVGTYLDITGRKQAEATILELNAGLEQKVEERTAQLQAVNKELESFSYSVSHDLRSPLRSIDGFSKVLLSEYESVLDEDGKEYLHTIRQATQRMGHLIDDLLKLSKVSRTELNRFEVDLSEMATGILGELRRETPGRKVDCRVMPGLIAHVDHRLLHIALQNLLSNAWKYSSRREEATIEVGKTGTEKGETYFIKDNGAGFDLRNAEKLFGAFQRMHSSREFEGTGIGLAIVQRIILKHGGEIWAQAMPGQGATFFFTLPAL